jgi:hypothetical protein
LSGGSKIGRQLAGLIVLLLALAGGGLIALSPDIALPLAVLLLPGLIALMFDRSHGCGVARAILLFQGAACVHPVMGAWYRCAGIDGCMSYLAEWQSIVPAWLAAAAGWTMFCRWALRCSMTTVCAIAALPWPPGARLSWKSGAWKSDRSPPA